MPGRALRAPVGGIGGVGGVVASRSGITGAGDGDGLAGADSLVGATAGGRGGMDGIDVAPSVAGVLTRGGVPGSGVGIRSRGGNAMRGGTLSRGGSSGRGSGERSPSRSDSDGNDRGTCSGRAGKCG